MPRRKRRQSHESYPDILKRLVGPWLSLEEVRKQITQAVRDRRNSEDEADRIAVEHLTALETFLGTGELPTPVRPGIFLWLRQWEPLVRQLAEQGEIPENYLTTYLDEIKL